MPKEFSLAGIHRSRDIAAFKASICNAGAINGRVHCILSRYPCCEGDFKTAVPDIRSWLNHSGDHRGGCDVRDNTLEFVCMLKEIRTAIPAH